MEKLCELYTKWCETEPVSVEKLPAAGSNRIYYRMTGKDGKTIIGVVGTSCDENHAFVYLANHFSQLHLSVPHVLAVSEDESCYLQTDLGGTSLFDALKEGREKGGQYNEQEKALLRTTIRELPRIQILGARGLDWSNCYPQPEFDMDSVMFDLNYFKYCFLKATGLDFHELKLEADFRLLASDLLAEKQEAFLYRDFQARNVMLCQQPAANSQQPTANRQQPYFIDFQGGRKGPIYYDVASFLWQASARYPSELRKELLKEYYESLKNYMKVPSEQHFNQQLQLFVLFRTLQVLGAYGFRGYFERKKHFIDSIPSALDNLRQLLDEMPPDYPYLLDVLRKLVEKARSNDGAREHDHSPSSPSHLAPSLIVRVFSFSYKKGIPEDQSGNGGGYVFDCRSTHNPGRYEPYKKLTGLDASVIRFLEDDGEILTFLDSVYKLADHHVERYLQRGFTSLMFSFGCTGGQHRSVYSAQHLAEHIHRKYGVEVRLCHREQGITQTLTAGSEE